MDGDIIELNVGGVPFTTTKQTLCGGTEPNSMLAAIVTSGLPSRRDATGRIFIDRDGLRFRTVFNYLRSASFHCTHDRTALHELAEEAEFFGLENLLKKVNTEISRIELEDDIKSMASACLQRQKSGDLVLARSLCSTRALGLSSALDIVSSSGEAVRRDGRVAQLPVFEMLVPNQDLADGFNELPLKETLKSLNMDNLFTLDAEF